MEKTIERKREIALTPSAPALALYGITGYEDVETIVSTADLLANDTLGGFSGRDLSITGLTNFRHGSGFIDANGFAHFNPEANYAGTEAGFDYSVQAVNDVRWVCAA